MKGLLFAVALVSCLFAGDIDPELQKVKQELAAKHDKMQKMSVAQYSKHVSSFEKFTKEELDMEEAISQPAGPAINEDAVIPKTTKEVNNEND